MTGICFDFPETIRVRTEKEKALQPKASLKPGRGGGQVGKTPDEMPSPSHESFNFHLCSLLSLYLSLQNTAGEIFIVVEVFLFSKSD